jgi:ATP-binding cassette subfamily F protein 3
MAQEILHVTGLSKTFGTKVVLDQVDLSINAGDRIGVIGRNGAGKSTLFRILTGQIEEDAGSVELLGGARLGILEQDAVYNEQELVVSFLERYTGAPSWEAYRLAQDFGLSRDQMDGAILDLSGGYRMRMMIVALLLQKPDVLLLDEPTNYMDLSTILALESFLQDFRGTLLVISHDREFLRRVTDQTLEVDQGNAIQSTFPLDEYLVWKDQEVMRKERENEKIAKKQEQLQRFVDRFGAKATKASQAKSKLKQIHRLDRGKHTVYRPDTTVRIAIPNVMSKSGPAITSENFSAGYELDSMIIQGVDGVIERGSKVAVVGDNGEGKSTFLKSILGKIPHTQGAITIHPQLRVGWYSQYSADALPLDLTAWEYARQVALSDTSDQRVRDMLGSFLFSSNDVDKSISVLSGGERSRLALLGLFLQAFDMYLLDEPSNHLDVETSEILALSLKEIYGYGIGSFS